ncbi:MAG: hypothetical protein ABS75_26280 [Pelagibacterium sp. SCN 63-23]|nr:MAG: hypothetical protein ABS75_26280 [Pelagibacterium sp. SCN 63-23]
MLKLTTLMLAASLATILPSAAQVAGPRNTPEPSESQETEARDCSGGMGFVRRVTPAEIAAIGERRVWLEPVCETTSLFGRRDNGMLFHDGNANTLRQPIARNATLMNALRAKGYDQHDVVSVVFGARNSVLLYVHQREMN